MQVAYRCIQTNGSRSEEEREGEKAEKRESGKEREKKKNEIASVKAK